MARLAYLTCKFPYAAKQTIQTVDILRHAVSLILAATMSNAEIGGQETCQ